MSSLFTPLKNEGLTTLKIQYDFKTDQVCYYAAREWDPGLDFSTYNQAFYAESILTDNARYLNTQEVAALYQKAGLADYLAQVVDLLRQGKRRL